MEHLVIVGAGADVRARPEVSGRVIEVTLLRAEDADRAERIIRGLDGELELQRIQIDGTPGCREVESSRANGDDTMFLSVRQKRPISPQTPPTITNPHRPKPGQ